MLKLTTKTNFSFRQLLNKMPEIIDRQEAIFGKETAVNIKANILKGLKPPLKKSTVNIRKLRGRSGRTPLLDTGALYDSIKDVKGGVQMLKYGKYHHEGFTPKKIPNTLPDFMAKRNPKKAIWFTNNTKGIRVPARPFIFPSEEAMEKSAKIFVKRMREALAK